MSHTLLSLIDTKTGQPLNDVQQRLGIFKKMLDSGIPKDFFASTQLQQAHKSDHIRDKKKKVNPGTSFFLMVLCVVESPGLNFSLVNYTLCQKQ